MRKIIVLSMITLDGVMQAPGGPKEDTSGGFKYGGWVAAYSDEVYGKVVQKELKPADYLLGRKTFEIWANYWPQHGDFWPGINEGTKYVISKSMKKSDPLVTGWKNSVLIKNLADIKKLKNSKGPDIQVWGSSKLIQLLLKNELVDGRITYQLMESYWPTVVKNPTGNKPMDEFAVLIDNISKIVFSRTLQHVDWKNTKLKKEVIKEEVLELKQSRNGGSKNILVGSPSLIVALTQLDLI